MGREKTPDFFVIGAPKCGTTSLSEYLNSHPEVQITIPKEPHYFNDDMMYRDITSLEEYEKLYKNLDDDALKGEASALYFYSLNAVPNILKLYPSAKFILMLRNPIDMAYSYHSELLWNGQENIKDFRKAWRSQEERNAGQNIPKFCRDPQILQYGEICLLGAQLQRLLDVVDNKNLHIIIFDDFIKNTRLSFERILEFLGVSKGGVDAFPVYNSNKVSRSRFLTLIDKTVARIKKKFRIKRGIGLLQLMSKLNTAKVKRKSLPEDLREEMYKYFKEDIRLLENLLNRDLSRWK